jgi:hypothetical protein
MTGSPRIARKLLASPVGAAREIAWACGANTCPDRRYSTGSCLAGRFPRGVGACTGLSAGGIAGWSTGQATLAATLAVALTTERGIARPFVESQRKRLDGANRALVDWVKASHQAAMSLFFQRSGLSDTTTAARSYDAVKASFLAVATGLPEPAAEGIEKLSKFLRIPQSEVDATVARVRGDVLPWLFQQAFHMTVADARERFTKPHIWLDQLLGSGRPAMTLVSANALMRVIPPLPTTCRDPLHPDMDIAGACDLLAAPAGDRSGVHTFTVDPPGVGDNASPGEPRRVFPAAFNTVTMIKLSLMNPSDVNRLIDSLKQPGQPMLTLLPARGAPVAPPNAMLGFAATIDGSHQWGRTRYGSAQQMIAARDCRRYQQLFLDQRPDIGTDLRALAMRPSPPGDSDWEPSAMTICAAVMP